MFYKLFDEHQLHAGPTVQFPTGEYLSVETKDQYELPFEGWHYFETEEEAKEFFGIVDENV